MSRELKHYKNLLEKIKINLFIQRNSDGSQKEWRIFENLINKLNVSEKTLGSNSFDAKRIMENLDTVINGIMDLQQRKYVIEILILFRKMKFFTNLMKRTQTLTGMFRTIMAVTQSIVSRNMDRLFILLSM